MNIGEGSKFPNTVAQDDSRFYLFPKRCWEGKKNDKEVSSQE